MAWTPRVLKWTEDGVRPVVVVAFYDAADTAFDLILAMNDFVLEEGLTNLQVRDKILAWGAAKKSLLATRDSYATKFPAGTTLPNIP